MIDDNYLKTQDIRFNLAVFDSIHLTLQGSIKSMYLSSKNNHLFSKKYRFSCLSPTEHDLLDLIEVNFIKTQDVCSKIVAFYSIRLTIQVNIENMYFR